MNICKEESLCTGCSACACKCPVQCIEMRPNNEGFLYPEIDENLCVHCNICVHTCPVNNKLGLNKILDSYIVRNNNAQVLSSSTSGGIFSAIAESILIKDGFVYGAVYDKNMYVTHAEAATSQDILKMRGSKYVQSDLKLIFLQVEQRLKDSKPVLFTGTPCQIAGLKAYLGKEFLNLITVDLVCHGVSSPLIFDKYVKSFERKYKSRVTDVRFRNKTYGYHSSTMKVCFENGQSYLGSGRVDQMSKAYFEGACSRYCCYKCPFKGRERTGDITLFDSWNVNTLTGMRIDDNKGFSNILINTQKGKILIEQTLTEKIDAWKVDLKEMIKLDGVMIDTDPAMHRARKFLLKELTEEEYFTVLNKYFPVRMMDKVLEHTKAILFKLGILSLIQKR